MAKIVSPVWSEIKGSIAGITYTSNQYAAIVARQRVTPVNPNSSSQNRIRTAFSTTVQAWSSLTDVQREAWDSYADTLSYSGIGGSYTPSGRQVFIANISWAWYLRALGVLSSNPGYTAPSTPGFLSISNLDAVAPGAGETGKAITFYNDNGEAVYGVAYRSFKQAAGRQYYKGPWVSSSILSVNVEDDASGNLEFQDLDADGVYFNNLRLISEAAPFRISSMAFLRWIAETTSV